MALERKQGVSNLELMCKELLEEERVKEQRQEKKRQKKKKKRAKSGQINEKENLNMNEEEKDDRCSEVSTTVKVLNFSDTKKRWCNHPKIGTKWPYSREMPPKDADGIANSEDSDQTAPRV